MKDLKQIENEDINFEDIAKDIYKNQKLKGKQIDLLIQELHSFIQTADDALMIAPIIKEYFDVAIKNDEHLVKLASVIQRYITKSVDNSNSDSVLLSDSEKEELMGTLQETVNDLQKENDRLENIKNSSNKIIGT